MAVAPRYQLYSVENDTVALGSFSVAYKKLLPPDRPRGTKIVELPLHPGPLAMDAAIRLCEAQSKKHTSLHIYYDPQPGRTNVLRCS